MKLEDLVVEAKGLLVDFSSALENKVLRQRARLRPEHVSLLTRIRDACGALISLLEAIGSLSEGLEANRAISISKHAYLVARGDGFHVARSKPMHVVLSYSRDSRELSVRTRDLLVKFTPSSIIASALGVRAEVEAGKLEDYLNSYDELKYVFNRLVKVLTSYLSPAVEARARTAK